MPKNDLDYGGIRASMVIIFFFFGYQKWFEYEVEGLIPLFSSAASVRDAADATAISAA